MIRFIKIKDDSNVVHHINVNNIIEIRQYPNNRVAIVTYNDLWYVRMTVEEVYNKINQ